MARKSSWHAASLVQTGLLVGAGAALAEGMKRWLPPPDLGTAFRELSPPWLLLELFLAWILSIMVHEAGHFLAGRLAGLRFSMIVLGPFALVATPSGWRPRFLRRSLGRNAGFVQARLTGHESRARLVALSAGGPLGGILAALVAQQLATRIDWISAGSATGGVAFLLAFFAVMSFAMSAISLLPLPGFDGAKLLNAARRGLRPTSDLEAAQLEFGALTMSGARPRDWPPTLLDRLFPKSVPVGDLLRYHSVLDRGEVKSAGELLDRAVASTAAAPGIARAAIWVEKAYFAAFHRGDVATAHAALERSRKEPGLVDPCTRLRAEAAILLAQRRREEAFHRAEQGLRALAQSQPGAQSIEEPLLRELVLAATSEPRAA